MEDLSKLRSFNELINNNEKPVLVDFYADWCGPCKMVSPVIKRIAGEYKGKLITVKVDTDRKPAIAGQYQISSIPTIIMFFKGQPVMRLQGAHPYESIKQSIDSNWPL
ncbi:thioredoxin [Spirochaeta isovalerica]|uniref:Thioredoxin n=1 Tax=Spirochaeta isovalerica TaxID=150 RepID=A0A841R9I5_9SPIO|nr:thioredoxin [Spirochaeta isovalerica]MBB6480565.1 thioredoxin 1 [Spirochaeta isovalerica]